MRKRTALGGSIGLLVVAGLIGAACGGGGKAGPALFGGTPAPEAQPRAPAGRVSGSTGADQFTALSAIGIPPVSQKVIKNASVSLEVRVGTFDDRFQEATLVASRHGGFVESSQTSTGKLRSGSLLVRVPATEFEAALGELKGLGRVKSQRISGQDVTAQFVDLQARLRNWEAQESVLLRLMAKSTSIDESLKVQRTLQDVQLAIEEIRGQLRVLTNQTDFSTISLSVAEVGAIPVKTKPRTGLALAWHQALHGFVAVIAAVVVGVGYLLPIGILALVALLIGWVVLRRVRPKVAPTV
jgi:hypothetical protein